ncbi:MAG: hypothetical protein AB7N29_16280 [Vicinamibacterales bacterium]
MPNLTLPASLSFQPQLVILDLRFARWQHRLSGLLAWVDQLKAPVVSAHTLGDVESENALANSGFLRFSLDHAALSGFVSPASDTPADIDWGLARAATFLNRKHSINEIPGAGSLDELFVKCGELLDQATKADPSDLNRAHWILAMLRHMPVPLSWYEAIAREQGRSTLKRLISQVGFRSSRIESVGPVLQTVRMTLESLYNTLDHHNPKAAFLKALLPQRCAVSHLMCITRDVITDKAISAWLDSEFTPSISARVECVAAPRYRSAETIGANEALVIGALPRRYRWIVGGHLSQHVTFITYPHESEAVARQLDLFYSPTVARQHSRDRVTTLMKIAGTTIKGSDDCAGLPTLHLEGRPSPKKALKPAAKSNSMQDLSAMMQEVEAKAAIAHRESQANVKWEDKFDEEPPEDLDAAELSSTVDAVDCYRVQVHLRSRGYGELVLAKEALVECVRPSRPDEIAKVMPARLVAGDVLPRVDDRGRTTLFDTIVGLVDEQPTMRSAALMRREWQTAIRHVNERYKKRFSPYSRQIEYRTLLTDLQIHGATVSTEQAVRGWLEGTTMGPDSIGSIQAIGKLSQMDSIVANAKEFDKAFRKFRSLHQGIGRRLAAAIRGSFRRFADASSDQKPSDLDPSLAVPIAELLDSMDFAEVVSVPKTTEMLSPSQVGRFFKS